MLEFLNALKVTSIDWSLPTILQIIAAAGALGTAAFGLVDVSKVVRRALPSAGLTGLKRRLARFDRTLSQALPDEDWREFVGIMWTSGVAKDEQKAKIRALIRMGLISDQPVVDELARVGGVDQTRLAQIAAKLERGTALTSADLNLMGRVDAALLSAIDSAYERADFEYRNAARASAAVVAVVLGTVGGLMVFGPTTDVWFASAVGLIAVPLAPIAKDLSSSISAAVGAARALKGG